MKTPLHVLCLIAVCTLCHSFHIMAPRAQAKPRKAKAAAVKKDDGMVKADMKQAGSSSKEVAKEETKLMKKNPLTVTGKEQYAGQICRWATKPPAKCKACSQSSNEIDRHSPKDKPKYVAWVQWRMLKTLSQETIDAIVEAAVAKNKSKKEIDPYKLATEEDFKVPSGYECYSCYNVRRNWYKGKSMDELIEVRANDPAIEDEYEGRRYDDVSETKELKIPAAKKINTLEKADKDFERNFVSGTFQPIEKFGAARRIKWQTIPELAAIIRAKYPSYRVIVNKMQQVL